MGCGSIDPLVGGTVESSTIVSSTISGSTISDSTLNNSSITNLSSIDDSSAKRLLDALVSQLTDVDLQKLADALQPLLSTSTTKAPDSDYSSEITTVYYGESSVLLGKPASWLEIGGQKVPAYD